VGSGADDVGISLATAIQTCFDRARAHAAAGRAPLLFFLMWPLAFLRSRSAVCTFHNICVTITADYRILLRNCAYRKIADKDIKGVYLAPGAQR